MKKVAFIGHSRSGKSTLVAALSVYQQRGIPLGTRHTLEAVPGLLDLVLDDHEKRRHAKGRNGVTTDGAEIVVTLPRGEVLLLIDTPGWFTWVSACWSRLSTANAVVVVARDHDPHVTKRFLCMAHGVLHVGVASSQVILVTTGHGVDVTCLAGYWSAIAPQHPPLVVWHVDVAGNSQQPLLDLLESCAHLLPPTPPPGDGRFLLYPHRNPFMFMGVYLGQTALTSLTVLSTQTSSFLVTKIESYPERTHLSEAPHGALVTLGLKFVEGNSHFYNSVHGILGVKDPRVSGHARTLELTFLSEHGARKHQHTTVDLYIRGQKTKGTIKVYPPNKTFTVMGVDIEAEVGDVVFLTFCRSYCAAAVVVRVGVVADRSVGDVPYPRSHVVDTGVYEVARGKKKTLELPLQRRHLKGTFPTPAHYTWDLPLLSPLGVAILTKSDSVFQFYLLTTTSLEMINRAAYTAVVGASWTYLLQLLNKFKNKLLLRTDVSPFNFAALALESLTIPPEVLTEVVRHMHPTRRMASYLTSVLRSKRESSLHLFSSHFNTTTLHFNDTPLTMVMEVLKMEQYDACKELRRHVPATDRMQSLFCTTNAELCSLLAPTLPSAVPFVKKNDIDGQCLVGMSDARIREVFGGVSLRIIQLVLPYRTEIAALKKPLLHALEYGCSHAIHDMLSSGIVTRPFGLTHGVFTKFAIQISDNRILCMLASEPEVIAMAFDIDIVLTMRLHRNVRRLLTMWCSALQYVDVRPHWARTLGGAFMLWTAVHSMRRLMTSHQRYFLPELMRLVLSFC